ncbi:hypothetical protein DXG01_000921 [Tephrocybe rancida]|nr:hypothetical protein DXG01_000921 [Tephrocybe rancida]
MGRAWDEADVVRRWVTLIIQALQNVLLNGMMDMEELQALHARKELRFQNLQSNTLDDIKEIISLETYALRAMNKAVDAELIQRGR